MAKSGKNTLQANDLDAVLDMYYRRDVLGENVTDALPANIRDVEAVLQADGMIAPSAGRLRLTQSGRATYCTGGYTAKKRKENENYRWQVKAAVVSGVSGAIMGGFVSWLMS